MLTRPARWRGLFDRGLLKMSGMLWLADWQLLADKVLKQTLSFMIAPLVCVEHIVAMPAKSEIVLQLDRVQREIGELLKPLGFRRKGRTFVKTVDADMLQVIALQAGPFEIGSPPPHEVAHLRPNFYGKFTVNLGVFVPEILERTSPGFTPKGVVTDAHCSIRTRLSHITSHQDFWWSLAEPIESLVEEIGSLLIDVGVPFLNRFASRDAIVRDWVTFMITN